MKCKIRFSASILILALVFAAADANASLNIISTERVVSAFGTSFCPGCGPNGEDEIFSNGDSIQNTTWGLFDESVLSVGSNAGQISSISATNISGSGSVTVGFTGFNTADSAMNVEFQVSYAQNIQISGEVISSGFGGDVISFVGLRTTTGSFFYVRESVVPATDMTFDDMVALDPGVNYELVVNVSGGSPGTPVGGSWSLNMTPEPTTAMILTMGSFAVSQRRRRI